ncbi:MAG: hypothetical protein ACD_49C00052G0013 [uncultured bacterium (gcode 4)]|uniref:Uncharacterized protein n=1 Tax=uncultured bacterium (gcode 4) TaxID=1234023 RepID=K2AX53_9BACT|nr:MAG: hypothetical protein ACD_49C00052G0013 [uncultured bacterium (gcode 4)]
MVNTPKNGDNETPEVDTGRRKFLTKLIAVTSVAVSVWIWIDYEIDKLKRIKALKVKETQVVSEVKNFNNSFNTATENLLDAYEALEFDVAEKYFTNNYKNADINQLISLSMVITTLKKVQKLDDNIQKRINDMILNFTNEDYQNLWKIEWGITYSNDILAKKYPTLVPVIKEWKKKHNITYV